MKPKSNGLVELVDEKPVAFCVLISEAYIMTDANVSGELWTSKKRLNVMFYNKTMM